MRKKITPILFLLLTTVFMQGCNSSSKTSKSNATSNNPQNLPLEKIKLPKGFQISIFANGVNEARSMVRGDKGTIFVGNRGGGNVYAVVDNDNDYKADKVYTIASGLNMPCGVAFRKGSLYVAEVSRILRYDNIEANLDKPPKPVVVYDKYPTDRHHGWKFIAFGPDDKLYVPVGAPCNICERLENPTYASITRMNPDGSGMKVFASGVRNSVGFDWHPDTKELWFTDNGRDMLGDDLPSDELNHAPKKGMHFGYPYCHQGDTKDPKFGDKRPCSDFTPPAQKLGAHVAALGMRFYTGKMFPNDYNKKAFIAMHGSWNRSKKVGYKLALVQTKEGKVTDFETFAEGWLDHEKQLAWGRPVDVLQMPDGSLLVSDDMANVIYRITYK
ncbi:PQQ-dependent sugar dehydrogenase [Microscilla marina]|uniref:L-sorbosone dehydrogenase n=1 Tax=Microscilla marina ATCC 23134 TaxID=313606 RepID=A1ZJM2_MICM2|nr:sorbosone dehydrogenase family protein [Microscilla marina]EAY29325.1 L-sorbosone dehydrogenase [Microscilla marina ATCC 23134]